MYGSDVDSIEVSIEFNSFNIELDLLEINGEQSENGDDWIQAKGRQEDIFCIFVFLVDPWFKRV